MYFPEPCVGLQGQNQRSCPAAKPIHRLKTHISSSSSPAGLIVPSAWIKVGRLDGIVVVVVVVIVVVVGFVVVTVVVVGVVVVTVVGVVVVQVHLVQ